MISSMFDFGVNCEPDISWQRSWDWPWWWCFVVESYVWKENSHTGAKYEYKLYLNDVLCLKLLNVLSCTGSSSAQWKNSTFIWTLSLHVCFSIGTCSRSSQKSSSWYPLWSGWRETWRWLSLLVSLLLYVKTNSVLMHYFMCILLVIKYVSW